MKKVKFKVLMHYGVYIDANLLEKGLYACEKPFIYGKDETIESLVEKARKIQDMAGIHHISEKYFENLKQCQLVPILIVEAHGN